jgi:hypothetical protein
MDKSFEFVGWNKDLPLKKFTFKYKLTVLGRDYEFTEEIKLPDIEFEKLPGELLDKILDSLLLVLGISYWKTYCPENIKLRTVLTPKQAGFWNKVYKKGLGEFFYKNKIDFRKFDLFQANIDEKSNPEVSGSLDRTLLAVGGGKDSIVSAELLRNACKDFTAFTLGKHPIQDKIIELFGVGKFVVERRIDPKLIELNKEKGVYNGHIPISAIYHFVGLLLSALYGFRYVVFSNEASANYGNVEYLGEEINHQWSKSGEFEQMFQDYVKNYIAKDIAVFSILRGMSEIKVVQKFCKFPKYFQLFSSCNSNFKINSQSSKSLWCGKCSKCLFIFATLAAFLPANEIMLIFGKNLFDNPELLDGFKVLLGLKDHKPFDCVGTPDETRLAFLLAHERGELEDTVAMKMYLDQFSGDLAKIKGSEKLLLDSESKSYIPEGFNLASI